MQDFNASKKVQNQFLPPRDNTRPPPPGAGRAMTEDRRSSQRHRSKQNVVGPSLATGPEFLGLYFCSRTALPFPVASSSLMDV